jgi:hypothetical protein
VKIAAPATVVRARRLELAKVVTAQAARHADAGPSCRDQYGSFQFLLG